MIGQPAAAGPGAAPGAPAAESGELNYDELVVYHEGAALPSYLIVYSL